MTRPFHWYNPLKPVVRLWRYLTEHNGPGRKWKKRRTFSAARMCCERNEMSDGGRKEVTEAITQLVISLILEGP